jgi:hypothetical protein
MAAGLAGAAAAWPTARLRPLGATPRPGRWEHHEPVLGSRCPGRPPSEDGDGEPLGGRGGGAGPLWQTRRAGEGGGRLCVRERRWAWPPEAAQHDFCREPVEGEWHSGRRRSGTRAASSTGRGSGTGRRPRRGKKTRCDSHDGRVSEGGKRLRLGLLQKWNGDHDPIRHCTVTHIRIRSEHFTVLYRIHYGAGSMDSEAQGRSRGGSSVWCGRVARVCAALSRALAARHDAHGAWDRGGA